jgi:hypothetical protein
MSHLLEEQWTNYVFLRKKEPTQGHPPTCDLVKIEYQTWVANVLQNLHQADFSDGNNLFLVSECE